MSRPTPQDSTDTAGRYGPRAPDYEDTFRTALAPGERRSAEELIRSGLERAPWPIRRAVLLIHRRVLRLELGPSSTGGYILGWRTQSVDADRVELAAGGPLLDAVLLGRRTTADVLQLTTRLYFRRPAAARAVWLAVGPAHRRVAPLLLARAARRGVR